MKRGLKILVGVICLCSCVVAQIKYDQHPIAQKVQYDDDEPAYHQHAQKYSLEKEPSAVEYENKYKQQTSPVHYRPISSPYPQSHNYPSPPIRHASYHPQKVELPAEKPTHYQPNDPAAYYHSQESNHGKSKANEEYGKPQYEDPKTRSSQYEQSEELHYSHEPEQPSYYQPNSAHPPSYQPAQQSSYYPSSVPETSYPLAAATYQPGPQSNQYPPSTPETSHPAVPYHPEQQSNHHPSSAPEASYPSAAGPYQPGQQSHQSLVKRDPKLPLYFTMYEKRIIQDPTDKYGKGPWRYLTYGHGITYGSKEPGKVFEKGYGYIRALGRDHCKLPENQCPTRDEKPFEYDGRKEPYFGYRPH